MQRHCCDVTFKRVTSSQCSTYHHPTLDSPCLPGRGQTAFPPFLSPADWSHLWRWQTDIMSFMLSYQEVIMMRQVKNLVKQGGYAQHQHCNAFDSVCVCVCCLDCGTSACADLCVKMETQSINKSRKHKDRKQRYGSLASEGQLVLLGAWVPVQNKGSRYTVYDQEDKSIYIAVLMAITWLISQMTELVKDHG